MTPRIPSTGDIQSHAWRFWALSLLTSQLASPCIGQSLGVALDQTNLTWTTTGRGSAQGWYGQTVVSQDGVSAAASGRVFASADASILQTTVTGPGTLKFWWNDGSNYKQVSFNVGGTNLASLISYPSWQQQTIDLGAGLQTLQWVYSWQVYMTPGDTIPAYVDEVSYTPGPTAPVFTSQPLSQSQIPGCSSTFTVSANGTPPLSWQWHFNGEDISGATASSLTITNVSLSDLGNYSVTVSNNVGSLVSSNASLEFGQMTSWGLSGCGATATAPGTTNIQAIAAGSYFTLALRTDGSILGWGYNAQGQLTKANQLTNIMAVSANNHNCLALKRDGTVVAWGDDSITNVPAGLTHVSGIAAGFVHALALTDDGHVVAWGINYNGQTNVPADLSNVVAIAAGDVDSLALKADGTVIAWGSNGAPPTTLTNVVAITEGSGFCLALTADGKITSWGYSTLPQQTIPTNIAGVTAISAGGQHGMCLLEDGNVMSWGYLTAALTNTPAKLTNVVSISAGSFHNVALTAAAPSQALVEGAQLSDSGFSLSVPSQSGRVYGLEYKNSIDEAGWTRLPLVAGTGTTLILHDSGAGSGARFYRVRRW